MYRIHCKIMTFYLTVRNLRYWSNFHKTIMYTTTPRTEPDLLKERGLYRNLSKQAQLFPYF